VTLLVSPPAAVVRDTTLARRQGRHDRMRVDDLLEAVAGSGWSRRSRSVGRGRVEWQGALIVGRIKRLQYAPKLN